MFISMSSQVCVNCRNEKPVNLTDNRLVTESCGHIKCMHCLLDEKSGCGACILEKTVDQFKESLDDEMSNGGSSSDHNNESTVYEKDDRFSRVEIEIVDKKKKPETSHIRIETDANGRHYVCTLCKKKFHARSQVAYHAYCNGQRKPFQCSECNKSFATHSHYKYHMHVHRNERTYSCDVCGDSFFQMSKLQRHKLKHTNEKKFICDSCNKGFSSLSSLRKHELTHSEERPYSCTVCARRFRDGSNYRKHLAKHEGQGAEAGAHSPAAGAGARRAHQCPHCPRAFHSRKDMRRHAAVHTDSKPFSCKVCSRRFRRKDNLERHIRNTHPDRVPATNAVDCDLLALKQISNGHPDHGQNPDHTPHPDTYQRDKTILKILNPLPPLPQEVIQQHISVEVNENVNQNRQTNGKSAIDKSYILEANNARQSVIVGTCQTDKKAASPQGNEYVHKIRKANSMAKNIPLPPIDESKIIELEQKNNLDLGAPPKDMELYKKILYEKSELEINGGGEEETRVRTGASPEMHWRRKMKLNINW